MANAVMSIKLVFKQDHTLIIPRGRSNRGTPFILGQSRVGYPNTRAKGNRRVSPEDMQSAMARAIGSDSYQPS